MLLEDTLAAGFAALGVTPDGGAAARYRIYFEHLEKMNAVMNLTAISGEEDVARLHFLDCAALLGMADFRGKRVIDVGTGAGWNTDTGYFTVEITLGGGSNTIELISAGTSVQTTLDKIVIY